MQIIEDDLSGPEILALLEFHARHMEANSPLGACHYLDASGLREPDITVWSLWDGDALAGCGALREIDPTHGEIKSMRTADEHLGKGVGRTMLDHIVSTAVGRGYRRLSLETGSTPAFAAAIHLYETAGFSTCEPFAGYPDNEFSRFFTLELGS